MKHERIQLPGCVMDTYIPALTTAPGVQRPSIVICPGGGYQHLSDREAEPVALVFAAMGFNAFVVWYRLAPNRHPAALHDVASAVAWVRGHAQEFSGDPDAIAVAGFSAGGHAAGSLGVRWHDAELMAQAGLTAAQAKPNAMVLCYPVITGGEFAHRGSFVNLTGSEDMAVHENYSLDTLVSAQTPPTFLWHTFEDGAVPVENTLLMASALRRAGVLTEAHIFPHGGHGLALAMPLTSTSPEQNIPECAAWPEMAARFLRDVLGK
ncbi:MAG: alpha/beta hydrolase [Clostridiales bacterium]|nr:alpha/beta hydrolase [Clostridiales bacterium]